MVHGSQALLCASAVCSGAGGLLGPGWGMGHGAWARGRGAGLAARHTLCFTPFPVLTLAPELADE